MFVAIYVMHLRGFFWMSGWFVFHAIICSVWELEPSMLHAICDILELPF